MVGIYIALTGLFIAALAFWVMRTQRQGPWEKRSDQ